MVLVALSHAHHTLHESAGPLRVARQLRVRVSTIMEAVRLYVGLVDHIEPHLVADGVPLLAIRIVAAPHCVEVCALHQKRVVHHAVVRDRLATHGIMLMTVDATYGDRAAVHAQHALIDTDLAQTDERFLRHCFARGCVLEREHNPVQMWRVG
eukprot:PRCOL_00006395-RA